MISADNQQERLLGQLISSNNYEELRKLSEEQLHYFLAGFVDGEGSFNVSFAKHPTMQSRWIILVKFQIYQHQNHRELLEFFREVLGTGRIDKKSGSDVLSLAVSGRPNLTEIIIPFFQRYPLATKADAFKKFTTIINMMNEERHRTIEGFEQIVYLAHTMNAEGRFRIYSPEYIIESARENLKT
jgi:hypothetical protein